MRFGSLFTGIGGFDLGFARAGMTPAWMCEKDAKCRALLKRRFPDVTIMEDVHGVSAATAAPVDLICGGFPCQDLSVAGKRAGLAGERSGLWHEFHRVLGELRPRWVVVENVPGLLSSHQGRDFGIILAGLVELGYRVTWRVLDAQYLGLAQRRKRVLIVGSLGDGASAEVLLESPRLCGNPPARGAAREGTAPTLASRTRGGGGLGTDAECDGAVMAWNQRGRDGGAAMEPSDVASVRASQGGSSRSFVASSLRAADGHPVAMRMLEGCDGGGKGPLIQTIAFHVTQDPISGDIAPAMSQGNRQGCGTIGVAQPLRGNPYNNSDPSMEVGMHVQSAMGVRRLTPTECERLQGFPDGWTDWQSDSARYRQLGNAVAVPVAEWIGRRIMEHD